MDLFSDLPEPNETTPVISNTSLSNNTIQVVGTITDDIFADLPVPSSDGEEKGVKRKLDEENDIVPENFLKTVLLNNAAGDLCAVAGTFAEKKGEREDMQDFHTIIDDYHKHVPELHSSVSRLAFYGVFDGHGGVRASRFASTHLHQTLAQKLSKAPLPQIEKEIKRMMTEVFKKTDEDFLKLAAKSKPSWKDGTTAVVVLVLQNVLYISNLGDSKAILCRRNKETGKCVAIPLSKDHSPTDYGERMRIQKAGGHVRDGRVMGVIEVSRSIGDGQYKALGVTSVPDIRRCQLTGDDVFVLLACDGLWKVFSSEEVIDVVMSSKKESAEDLKTEICYDTACNRLVNEAIRKYSGDNVTVVVVSIKQPS